MTPDSAAAMTTPRPAAPGDVPAIAAIVNGWIDATPWLPRAHPSAMIEGFVRDAFGRRELWVIGEPLAGYLSLDPETCRIHGLYCARTGAGIGRSLLDRARCGRGFLTLNTHELNRDAQRFYRREGFVAVGRVEPEPPETVAEIVMEWRR